MIIIMKRVAADDVSYANQLDTIALHNNNTLLAFSFFSSSQRPYLRYPYTYTKYEYFSFAAVLFAFICACAALHFDFALHFAFGSLVWSAKRQ